MILNVCTGTFSRDINKLEISDFKEVIKNPSNVKKEEADFWFPYNFESDKALKSSATEMTHLLLDVDKDSNALIVKVIKELKPFEYYLYTSKSATKANMKFRVILPLSEPIPMRLLKETSIWKKFIMAKFPYHDEDVARRFGGFYLPNKGEVYFSNANKGTSIDILKEFKVFHMRQTMLNKSRERLKFNRGSNVDYTEEAKLEVCMNQPLIKEYMNTYNSVKGKGNARDPQLYSALSSLLGMNACQEAWNEVADHAVMHNAWSRQEVLKKINTIKRGY